MLALRSRRMLSWTTTTALSAWNVSYARLGSLVGSVTDLAFLLAAFVEGDSAGIVTKCCHTFCRGCIDEVLQKAAIEDDDPAAPKYKADERPCPS